MVNQEELQARKKWVWIYSFAVMFFAALFILVVFIRNNNTIKPPEVYEFKAVFAGVPLKYDFATQLIPLLDSQATTTATTTMARRTGSTGSAYTFYLGSENGSLPTGLKLGADGVLRGTPTEEGDNEFEVCIKDGGGNSACRIYTMPVATKTTTTSKSTLNSSSAGNGGQNTNVVQGTTRTEKWEGTYTNRSVFDNTCTTDTVGPVSICMTWQGKNFTGITNYPGGLKDTYTNDPNDVCSYIPSCFGQPGHCGGDQNMTGYIDANGNLKFTFLQFPAGWFIAWDPKNPNLPGGQNSAVMTGNSMTIEFSKSIPVATHVTSTNKGSLTATKVSDSCK